MRCYSCRSLQRGVCKEELQIAHLDCNRESEDGGTCVFCCCSQRGAASVSPRARALPGGAGLTRPPEPAAEGSSPRHPACIFSRSDFEGPLTTRSFSAVTHEELRSSTALGSHSVRAYTGWMVDFFFSLDHWKTRWDT